MWEQAYPSLAGRKGSSRSGCVPVRGPLAAERRMWSPAVNSANEKEDWRYHPPVRTDGAARVEVVPLRRARGMDDHLQQRAGGR
jgi:hypothetical protein